MMMTNSWWHFRTSSLIECHPISEQHALCYAPQHRFVVVVLHGCVHAYAMISSDNKPCHSFRIGIDKDAHWSESWHG